MGLFSGDKTYQTTEQYVDTTEVGISDIEGVGFVGGDYTVNDPESTKLSFELAGSSIDAIQSVAGDAFSSQERLGMGAILATGAGFEQAARLAENALFRVAESNNPDARPVQALSQTNIETLIRFSIVGAAVIAIAWLIK